MKRIKNTDKIVREMSLTGKIKLTTQNHDYVFCEGVHEFFRILL